MLHAFISFSYSLMLERRNNYVELDSVKKCIQLTPYYLPTYYGSSTELDIVAPWI